ncbi:hypothetical protein CSIM01_10480 [Colletotrichum simmondsii]|uniref:Uncharacterized protein n=1 Tax=Colletotrichum simmondsii TaxID=703756 RepID=A0A135SQN2_9PEZI|nr:hypothetical protein CSIM01_10480 [Colletotrichum simmondsii]
MAPDKGRDSRTGSKRSAPIDISSGDSEEEEEEVSQRRRRHQTTRSTKAGKSRRRQASTDTSDSDDDEDISSSDDAPSRKKSKNTATKTTKTTGKGKGSGKARAVEDRECMFKTTDLQWVDDERKFHREVHSRTHQEIFGALDRDVPPITLEEMDQILPEEPDYDEDWSAEDEKKLVQDSEQDRGQQLLLDQDASAFPAFVKVASRYFRRSPMEFISVIYHLEWDQSRGKSNGKKHRWTAVFCKRLSELATHPLFEKNYKLLVLALQYASMMLKNDRRTWPISLPSRDRFFVVLGQVIKKYKGIDRDPAKIHEEARKRLKDGGYTIPLFSEFMLRLEELRAPTSGSTISNSVVPLVYMVGNDEANLLVQATNMVSTTGMPVFRDAPMYKSYTITRDTRERENPPKRLEQIPYLKRSLIAVWRHREKAKKRAQRLGTDSDQEHEESVDLEVGILRERIKEAEATCTRILREKDSMAAKLDAAETRSTRDGMRIAELEAAEAQGASGAALARIAELEAEIQRLKDNSSTRGSTVHSRSFGDDGFGDGFDFSDPVLGGDNTGHSSVGETPGNPTSHVGRSSDDPGPRPAVDFLSGRY